MKISHVQLLDFLIARYYFQDSQSFVKEILKQYPNFRYTGPAFRSVILGVDKKFIKKPEKFLNSSFAKSFSGINSFLMNYYAEGSVDVNRVVIVEADIEGLDLSLVINHLEDCGLILDEVIYQLRKEEEIIAVKVKDLRKVSNNLFWQCEVTPEIESLREFLSSLIASSRIGRREWQEALFQLKGINFLNNLLGIDDDSISQADLFLSLIDSKVSPEYIGQKLYELGFVLPDPYEYNLA